MGVTKRIRKLARRVLNGAGLQVVRPTAFNRLLHAEHKRSSDYVVVQVGANDGIAFDELYDFVRTHDCRGLLFEPVPMYFALLSANYAAFPKMRPVQVALHKTATRATLYRVDSAAAGVDVPAWAHGIASLDPDHHKRAGIPSEFIVEETVPCMPLMTALDEHGIDRIDLLQIDVEGYDAEVVRMVDFDRIAPRVIKYEHASLSDEDQADVVKMLKARGYTVFALGTDTVAVVPDVTVPDLSPPRPRVRRRRSTLTA